MEEYQSRNQQDNREQQSGFVHRLQELHQQCKQYYAVAIVSTMLLANAALLYGLCRNVDSATEAVKSLNQSHTAQIEGLDNIVAPR